MVHDLSKQPGCVDRERKRCLQGQKCHKVGSPAALPLESTHDQMLDSYQTLNLDSPGISKPRTEFGETANNWGYIRIMEKRIWKLLSNFSFRHSTRAGHRNPKSSASLAPGTDLSARCFDASVGNHDSLLIVAMMSVLC